MATRNQMSLVVLKLQLLEDELGRLYQGVECYCSDVINKGADSIRSRVKQEEAIDEFRLAYDTALNFLKKSVTEMEKFTKVPDITQQMRKNGSSETPMFKVITNLQTLRNLKQQFQQMITNLLSEMLQLGNRFLTNQGSKNPTQGSQGAHLNNRRASHTFPRNNVEFKTSDVKTTGFDAARRASIDTSSRMRQAPNLNQRRASYDVHRSNQYLQKRIPDIRMTGNDVQKPIPESPLASEDNPTSNTDTSRQKQDMPRPIFEFPAQSFEEVSRQLETCLVFVMEKRLEFGEVDRNEFSDILSLFGGESLARFRPGKSQLPFSMVSRQDHIIEKLIERIDNLERKLSDKSADLTCLDAEVEPLVSNVNEMKNKCDQLEEVATVQYEAVEHLNETVTSMKLDLVNLQQRFEHFLRLFAASRSESTKQYMKFDRRMSDVEKYKDSVNPFSSIGRIHQNGSRELKHGMSVNDNAVEGENSVDVADGAEEVFDTLIKKTVQFADGETELQKAVHGDQDQVLRSLRMTEETILTS